MSNAVPRKCATSSGDVAAPFAQRRQFQRQDVDPVVQVLAEAAGRDLRRQIAVGRRQQPHVDAAFLERADAAQGAVLQHAQ